MLSDITSVASRPRQGQFISRSFSNAAGTRIYKLYIPESCASEPLPLIVMLHGCTQDPDDFAAGTRMNELANERGFLVVYPAQSTTANGSNCWNWFDPAHQAAGRGEPSLIAGIAREVASICPVDTQRIFVAGLSAGAAMAIIVGTAFPELFAAVGVHSGLPYGAAHDVASAFAAMRGGAGLAGAGITASHGADRRLPPIIVFHGDRDTMVHVLNASAIVAQAVALRQAADPLRKTVHERQSVNGREYTVTDYCDSSLRTVIEEWMVHGAGHAWFGGCSAGSFTDVIGPDASAQMVRFFLAHPAPDLR